MEYVFRFLSGFAVTLMGCLIALLSMRRTIRENAHELEETEKNLTKLPSYIWVDVNDRLPISDGEYLVEYCFENYPDVRMHAIYDFDVRLDRFQHEGFHGMKVVRWAELPR
ncbi:MAG: hypothetical protein J6V38_07845 [Kiritimatiellae bacterium]|nr:hypothetical protein [Kiritimatiellia bacterium]